MKTVKFLALLMMLSLAWIGCEDRTRVKVETTDNTEATLDDAYRTSKMEIEKTIADLRASIDAKIEAAERDFEAATDDGKAEITVRLDGYRKQRNDLEQLAKKIGDATAEGWADVERESAEVIADIKEAINN
jgi:PBP1b-binding outer membrane lipoprotein LpoB